MGDINEALKKFFENDENHSLVATLEEEIIPTKKRRVRNLRPEPTVHELCKEVADRYFEKHLKTSDTQRPSRKKSVPRINLSVRILSEHKRSPEETYSYNNNI